MKTKFTHLDESVFKVENLPLDLFLNYSKYVEPLIKREEKKEETILGRIKV